MIELKSDSWPGPRAFGELHGESFREQIQEVAEIRLELALDKGAFPSRKSLLAVAREHLPILEQYDRDLFEELMGIATGADCAPALIVAHNHYTDLRDLGPAVRAVEAARGVVEDEGGCTAVYSPTSTGGVLGMTWDTHGTAAPFVMMLHVPAHHEDGGGEGRRDVPEAWVFSVTGCLGMAGLNAHGVGVAINNLNSLDARVGLVWPALIRDVLSRPSAGEGGERVLGAPMGSGHHYFIADPSRAIGIETSGAHRRIVHDDATAAYLHTNHCFDPVVARASRVLPTSSTYRRYDAMSELLTREPVEDAETLWRYLGSHEGHPRSICSHLAREEAPHGVDTCGGVVMKLGEGELWATQGCLHEAQPERFFLGGRAGEAG